MVGVFILYENPLLAPQSRHAPMPREEGKTWEKKRKGTEARRADPNTHPDEEQNGKQKKKKETGSGSPTQDHSVTTYDAQGSYGEPILFTFPAHMGSF